MKISGKNFRKFFFFVGGIVSAIISLAVHSGGHGNTPEAIYYGVWAVINLQFFIMEDHI